MALGLVATSASDVAVAAPGPEHDSGLSAAEAPAPVATGGCQWSRLLAARAPGAELPGRASAANGAESAGTPIGTPMVLSAADEAAPEQAIPEDDEADGPEALTGPEAGGDMSGAPASPESGVPEASASGHADEADAPEAGAGIEAGEEIPEPPLPTGAEE